MKAIAITNKGFEDITAKEIKELISCSTTKKEHCVLFSPKDFEQLCTLCYSAQSIHKIILLLSEGKIKDLEKDLKKTNFDQFLDKKTTIAVRSEIFENKDITNNIEADTGAYIIDSIEEKNNYKQKVNLNNPDITFFVFVVKDQYYFGIDLSVEDLTKRDYKIFVHPASINPTIAYSLLRLANIKEDSKILDPFMRSGEIPIEAGLFFTKLSPHYFKKDKFGFLKLKFINIDSDNLFEKIDKKSDTKKKTKIIGYDPSMNNLVAAKKNAKIANINKAITLSKIETDWLDTKFKKEEINAIITKLPEPSKSISTKTIEKLYNELFHQAEYILKKDGSIIVLIRGNELIEKTAQQHKFKIAHKRTVFQGKMPIKVLIFKKI